MTDLVICDHAEECRNQHCLHHEAHYAGSPWCTSRLCSYLLEYQGVTGRDRRVECVPVKRSGR